VAVIEWVDPPFSAGHWVPALTAAGGRPVAAQAELAARQLPRVPVWAIEADGLIVRPGPRLVDGVEALASILHPGQVPAAPDGLVCRIA
jgi:iron complex transport system substrate-binding protein